MRNEKGQFLKGTGGRPKGSKNKKTDDIRTFFIDFVHRNKEQLQAAFDELDAKDKFKYLMDLSKFILPSLKAVEFGNILDELTEEQFSDLMEKLKVEYSQN